MFRNTMNKLGAELIMQSLTRHIAANISDDAGSELVTVNWDLNVSNPVQFLAAWKDFSKSAENYDWNADASAFQSYFSVLFDNSNQSGKNSAGLETFISQFTVTSSDPASSETFAAICLVIDDIISSAPSFCIVFLKVKPAFDVE